MEENHAEDPWSRPHFCMQLGCFWKQLRIPANFMKYIAKDTATSATITGPSKNIWPVKVFKGMRGTYLKDGWHKFVKDHCLHETDLLTFRYDGNMNFTVQIFDKTLSCEKEDALVVKGGQEERKKRVGPEEIPLENDSMPKEKPCPSAISLHMYQRRKKFVCSGQNMPIPTSEMSVIMRKKPSFRNEYGGPLNEAAEAKEKPESPSFMSENPSFIKYMSPLSLSDKALLRIPTNFVKYIEKEAAISATITGPSGGIWHVEVLRGMNGIYLNNGWHEFVKVHFLQKTDILMFRYNGDMNFKVRIFDNTSCEKEDGFLIKDGQEGRKKRMKSGDIPLEINSRPSRGISLHGQTLPLPTLKMSERMGKTLAPKISLLGSPLDGVEEAKKKPETQSNKKKKPESPENSSITKYMKLSHLCKNAYLPTKFSKSHLPNRQHPSFTRCLLPWNLTNYLVVPGEFANTHLPRNDVCMVLHEPVLGRNWNVKYLIRRNRKYFSGGWLAFVHENELKEGDTCTFELVGELEMNVHILRS